LDAIVLEITGACSETTEDIINFNWFKIGIGKVFKERVEVIVGCVWGVW
jgi:hypothetical protein